jgi:hypothetical protein
MGKERGAKAVVGSNGARELQERALLQIYQAGASGKRFDWEHNNEWAQHTRPFLEAFFHAKFFLEMAVKYGKELKEAPETLPSGWAALLYFYNIR